MADDLQADKTPEQLRAEQAERDAAAKAEADRIAAEAAERARVEAEAKAKREAEEVAAKAEAERQAAIVPDPPREVPAADRLRAFEDAELGKDAVRIGGRIERGYGSPFAGLSDEKKRQYAALEKLVEAEQRLADAHAALIQAEADHEAALKAAEPKPDAG